MTGKISRRQFMCAVAGCAAAAAAGCSDVSHTPWFRANFRDLSPGDLDRIIADLEREQSERYGKAVTVGKEAALPGVHFAYALDISRCVGCRRCVHACVEENNQSRDPEIQWIRVLEMDQAKGIDFHHADPYYAPETVPREGHFYLPVACQQCENPHCVKSCPVGATWQEDDGIVAIDYDWCIGCRCCLSACPYGARRFNWAEPVLAAAEMNPQTHYLGNRPRMKGVVEKCTFCIQRVRNGSYPRCVEVCPTGSRKFGNLLDPASEIRYILDHKRVVVLKNELNTRPRFYYFFGWEGTEMNVKTPARGPIEGFLRFVAFSARQVTQGGTGYWAWVGVLVVCVIVGAVAYVRQYDEGLITTALRDQVSWGFYIGNFTFLVGVAAAAVLLVIPAYVYHWKPIKEVVILGELLAIAAIIMCGLFVMVDIGHPERAWHLLPLVGRLNVPSSLLGWDVLVLNGYLLLNLVIATSLLSNLYRGKEPNKKIFYPLVLLSIPAAIGIHTVTAFLYNGFPSRPFWNASILAPRFLASAFCSGPAVLLILMQLLRRFTRFEIKDDAIWKVAELMSYAMFLNLFLLGAEVFKEYYSNTEHLIHMRYMFTGVDGHTTIVPWMWLSVACSVVAFLLFLIPRTRRHPVTLNIGCVLIFVGVYLEKGMGLVIPGMTPDTLGEIYEYFPTVNELLVSLGILAIGSLAFTLMVRVATPIMLDYNAAQGGSTDP